MTTDAHSTEFLVFLAQPTDTKTSVWGVYSRRTSVLLGGIKWYSPWRQYCFFPVAGTVFNRGCLDDINTFIATQMNARKQRAERSCRWS